MSSQSAVLIWRGRVKTRWESLGFNHDVFEMFMRMRGAGTRLDLMEVLSRPMDRLQLARELSIDWKAVDHHVVLLNRYGLVREDHIVGRVRMYRRTTLGESLLRLLKESDMGTEGEGEAGLLLSAESPSQILPDQSVEGDGHERTLG